MKIFYPLTSNFSCHYYKRFFLAFLSRFLALGLPQSWLRHCGEPRWQDKHVSWQALRDLHAAVSLPWLVMGDINEILYSFEKEGGNPRPNHYMQNFRSAIEDCELTDCGYVGEKFTDRKSVV